MSDSDSFSTVAFDRAVDDAWRMFRCALADRLAAGQLPHVIDAPGRPDMPFLRFAETGRRRLRCEIPAVQRYLVGVPAPMIACLTESGWQERRSGALVLEVGRRYPDRLAAAAVGVLRELWQLPHPAFLDPAAPQESRFVFVATPRGQSELQNLAAGAIAPLLDFAVDRDENGDVYLYAGPRQSRLVADSREPTLEFSVVVLDSVDDLDSIRAEIDGCREWLRDIRLTFDDAGRLVAALTVEATVFVDQNLESALAKWVDFMQNDYQRIVDRLGATEPRELPAALLCLLHLDDLDAAQVSRICSDSRDDILAYISVCSRQISEWRAAGEVTADREEATVCGGEADAWEQTRQQLIGALRHTVLGE